MAPAPDEPETDLLLASVHDAEVRGRLFERYRARLKRMIAVRLDRRLAPRLDPSDVVQDVLLDAERHLDDYAQKRPIPFYPWLRRLAKDQLHEVYRRHVAAEKQTVTREQPLHVGLPDESAWELAERVFAVDADPATRLRQEEVRARVQAALAGLPETDREVLVMRHLEHLPPEEIATVLGVTVAAIYTRHLRAVRRLKALLIQEGGDQ